MKNLVLLLFACFAFSALNAQKEGAILFTETMKIEIDIPEDSPIPAEELRKMMPSERVVQRQLLFNSEATIYSAVDKEETDDHEVNAGNDEVQIRIKMVGDSPENKIYRDLDKKSTVQKRDFMGKLFLIQDGSSKLNWKLGTETKTILDYECRKATAEQDGRTLEAWFTTKIPVASGPDLYAGLPGMILEVASTSERGSRKITASKVDFKTISPEEIMAPKKGKKISRKAFDKVVEEKTKEMQEQMGGRGGIRIIRN